LTVHVIEFHDGTTVDLEFLEKKHWYSVDGEYVPATTTVLDNIAKPGLVPWAASMGARWFLEHQEEKLSLDAMAKGIRNAHRASNREALKIGHQAHGYCQNAIEWKLGLRKEIPEMPPHENAVNSVNAFRNWVKEHDVNWFATEQKVYNREHKYAGTLDAVAEVDDEFCVIDFKTSKAIYSAHHLQCAAYASCVSDMYGRDVDCSYVLRLDKLSGEFEAAKSTELDDNLRGFLGFLAGYRRLVKLEN